MPKVTEAYKQEKRNMIVRSTWEIFEKKPLYDISMLDVVKKQDYLRAESIFIIQTQMNY